MYNRNLDCDTSRFVNILKNKIYKFKKNILSAGQARLTCDDVLRPTQKNFRDERQTRVTVMVWACLFLPLFPPALAPSLFCIIVGNNQRVWFFWPFELDLLSRLRFVMACLATDSVPPKSVPSCRLSSGI